MPDRRELHHAASLLDEAAEDHDWSGKISVIDIDQVCRFDFGDGPCDMPLKYTVVLPYTDLRGVHVLAVCTHHARIIREAVSQRRETN